MKKQTKSIDKPISPIKDTDIPINSDLFTSEKQESNQPVTTAIQNNFNFVQNVNLQDLTILAQNNPELADRYMNIVEKSQDQAHIYNTETIKLEKNEQKVRLDEIPHLRKYTFRGQTFAFLISILGLGTSILFAFLDLAWQAIVAPITIPIGILAIKFLGGKSDKKDKLETKKDVVSEKSQDT